MKSLAALAFVLFPLSAYAADACFHDKKYDENIVYITSVSEHPGEEDHEQGTGFILPDHTIMTANHVVADGDHIYLNWSDGSVLGEAVVIHGSESDETKGLDFVRHDVAVLRVIPNNGVQKNRLMAASGLALSNSVDVHKVKIKTPIGVAVGASGAPVLDANGTVVGLVSGATATQDEVNIYDVMTPTKNVVIDADPDAGKMFPNLNSVYLAPVGNFTQNGQTPDLTQDFTIPGYPLEYCVSYTATLRNMAKEVSFD